MYSVYMHIMIQVSVVLIGLRLGTVLNKVSSKTMLIKAA